jgi:outer membrane immunogenic protein
MRTQSFLKFSLVAAALVSTTVAADAADTMRPPAYQPPIPVLYDWSGFYVGGHLGAGWTDGEAGFLGGGQAGFNYQAGWWVFGVEGQISATSIKDSASATFFVPGGPVGTAVAEANLDWVSTLAVRAGWAAGPWLVYGKVGGAWAHVSVDAFAGFVGGPAVSAKLDDTVSGWMFGLGTEYALHGNWTAKAEYNMLDFGNELGSDATIHLFKAGVNYRFGGGPAPRTRY